MAKDINLNAPDWCDIIFEDKNKAYGAYVMRQKSGHRHMVALGITMLILVFVIFLPSIISTVKKLTQRHEVMDQQTVLSDLANIEDQVKEENIERATEAPPPPPLKTTIKFTAPEITDEPIDEGQELASQDDVNSSRAQVSVASVQGTDDVNGVDIADLDDHKVIVAEPILVGVEQEPQFPGGLDELMRFIKRNLVYPQQATDMGIEGRVVLRFVVNKNGEVSDIELLRKLDPVCDKEALRVVKMMPKWIPGRQNGRAVPVYYTLPIVYKLNK